MSANNEAHVGDYDDAFFSLLIESASGALGDNSQIPQNVKAEDVVQMIRERLENLQSAPEESGFDLAYGGADGVSKWAENAAMIRPRASSTVSSETSGPVRTFEEDLLRGWQPVGEAAEPTFSWEVPMPQRRATFDQSDLTRYVSQRPAWKCKFCQGVGWAEEEPCDGCGRYLPENYVLPPKRRIAREGDWLCECCANTNWEWRTQCNRCHTCRSDPLPQPAAVMPAGAPVEDIVKQRLRKRLSTHPAGVFKDNDWVCVSCGNINWDWRVKCHQCACAKPSVPKPSSAVPGQSRSANFSS